MLGLFQNYCAKCQYCTENERKEPFCDKLKKVLSDGEYYILRRNDCPLKDK